MREKELFNLFNNNPSLVTHCPVCNLRFNPLEARVLQEGEESHLVYVKCRHCQAGILTLIAANNLGVSSIGLITDLSGDDILKFKEAAAISCDDVIAAHNFFSQEKVLRDYLS